MAGSLTLRHKLFLARMTLLVEALWPLLIPVVGAVNLYLAFALYDGPRLLPLWAVLALLGIWRLVRRLNWPTAEQAARRLERDSRIQHQPLSVLTDQPAAGGDAHLWQLHCQRMQGVIDRLRPGWPRINLLVADPLGLRFWVFVPLGLGLVVGFDQAGERLRRSVWLDQESAVPVQVWIAPPAATGLAPFVLDANAKDPVDIPAGSVLRATAELSWGRAVLAVDSQSFEFEGEDSQHIQHTIHAAHSLTVRRWWQSFRHWNVRTVDDMPPQVAFIRPPQTEGKRGSVRVGVEARDDYGLVRVWLQVQSATGELVDVDLPRSPSNPRSTSIEARINSDEVALAGQTVTVVPMAQDSADQTGSGDGVQMVWPGRNYNDPTAKQLNRLRQAVLDDPALAPPVAQNLGRLAEQMSDLGAALALGVAKRDLESPDPDINDAQRLLLGAANAAEDQAKMNLHRRLTDKNHPLDTQTLMQMVENLLASDDEDGESLPLDRSEMEDLLHRLDQLSAQAKNDGALRQRLDQLAQKLAERLTGRSDPFGHQRVGHDTGDDQTTKLPDRTGDDGLNGIVDDIRGRIMDGTRPPAERDYLKRLLDWPSR